MNVPDHSHCEICGIPVTRGERFCGSPECEAKHEEAIKTKKRTMYMFVALLVAVVLLTKLPSPF